MFVTVDMQTIFNTKSLGTFMKYLYNYFHMYHYSGSLIIAVTPEVKYKISHDCYVVLYSTNKLP
jgi:hypothetical protein